MPYNYYGNPYAQTNYSPYYNKAQEILQQYNRPMGLQGKIVDNIEVVKAIDIPLDGSVSYFPLVDGSSIVTRQLQQDGTSKIVVYKPTVSEEKQQPKYITENDLKEIRDEIDSLKKQINKEVQP